VQPCNQRLTEVRWRPGQEASLAPPCSNLRFFGSKCTALKKVFVTLLGVFGAPSDSEPGALCPFCSPCMQHVINISTFHGKVYLFHRDIKQTARELWIIQAKVCCTWQFFVYFMMWLCNDNISNYKIALSTPIFRWRCYKVGWLLLCLPERQHIYDSS